jgi:hypothetical protein
VGGGVFPPVDEEAPRDPAITNGKILRLPMGQSITMLKRETRYRPSQSCYLSPERRQLQRGFLSEIGDLFIHPGQSFQRNSLGQTKTIQQNSFNYFLLGKTQLPYIQKSVGTIPCKQHTNKDKTRRRSNLMHHIPLILFVFFFVIFSIFVFFFMYIF